MPKATVASCKRIYFPSLTGAIWNFILNKKTPEGVYAGCVGVSKNYVEWHWKV